MKKLNIDRLMTNISVTHNRFFHCLMMELDMSKSGVVLHAEHLFRFCRIVVNIERRGIIIYGHDKVEFSNMGYSDIVLAVKFAAVNAVEYLIWRKSYGF